MSWGAMAASDIFFLDNTLRPILKILEKFPELIVLLVSIAYGYIAYVVLKSAYLADH